MNSTVTPATATRTAQPICEPAIAVNWYSAATWHEEPGAAPLRQTCPIEVDLPLVTSTPPLDRGPYPMTIVEPAAEAASIDVGTMILLERDRQAARRKDTAPVRFARVDYVGTTRNGRRLLHVRWFRTRHLGGTFFHETTRPPETLAR